MNQRAAHVATRERVDQKLGVITALGGTNFNANSHFFSPCFPPEYPQPRRAASVILPPQTEVAMTSQKPNEQTKRQTEREPVSKQPENAPDKPKAKEDPEAARAREAQEDQERQLRAAQEPRT